MAGEVKTEKKRTTYKRGSQLDMPEHVLNRAQYGYRWISAERLAEATDGYEPRGWSLFKDSDGKHIRRGDLILAQMPKDMFDAMKEEKEEARNLQLKLLLESQAAEMERDAHEFRKKGGKVKFEFKQE